jgi:hypothetical protein
MTDTSYGGARYRAQYRLVYGIAEAQATAERAHDNARHVYAALSRRERRQIPGPLAMHALAGYLHDLGFELAVQLVPAGESVDGELDRLRARITELERKPRCGRTDSGAFEGSTLGPCMLEHGHPGMHEEGSPTGFPVLHGARWGCVDQDNEQQLRDQIAKLEGDIDAVRGWASSNLEILRSKAYPALATEAKIRLLGDLTSVLDHLSTRGAAPGAEAPDGVGNAADTEGAHQ